MSIAVKLDERYSYADYLTWSNDERWEIIEGVPYSMSPAPGTDHQSISFELSRKIGNFLKGKRCRAFAAPFDVRLFEENVTSEKKISTIVQPDISVICDENKLDKKGCAGAPDLVIEILSPSTSYKDEGEKLKLYEKYGVKEYWIVNPKAESIVIFYHEDGEFTKPDFFNKDDIVESRILEGFSFKLPEIWQQ